jgi:acyl carrier protein
MTAALRSGRVVAVIAGVLGCDPAAIQAATALYELPGFDSVALVTILGRLEDELGAEIPAEWIVPEAFTSIGALTGLLDAAAGVVGGGDRP